MAINGSVSILVHFTILLFTQAPIRVVLLLGTILLTLYYIVLFGYVWKLCMGINISVQYNGRFLPDIILLTQSYLRGTRLNTMHGLCTYNLYNTTGILLLHCLMVYYIVSGLFLLFFWCPCMASNVSVQYNGPDIILRLLTQFYYHRGTRSNAMKRFCIFSY